MRHLYLFYLSIMFSIGIVSIGFVSVLYLKTREAVLRYYLFFAVSFSALAASSAGFSYMLINLPALQPHRFEFLVEFLTMLTAFTMPLFLHVLLNVPMLRLKTLIIGGLLLLVLLQYPFGLYVLDSSVNKQINMMFSRTIFIGIMLYSAIYSFLAVRNEQNIEKKRLAHIFSMLLIIFLPGIAIDAFIDNVLDSMPPFGFPLLYGLANIVFAWNFFKSYGHHTPQIVASIPLNEPTPPVVSREQRYARYNLSARELEVVPLILDGFSNQKIADTLCISLSTVKTHISNIYQKCNVKSRFELMTLFKDIPSDSQSQ